MLLAYQDDSNCFRLRRIMSQQPEMVKVGVFMMEVGDLQLENTKRKSHGIPKSPAYQGHILTQFLNKED